MAPRTACVTFSEQEKGLSARFGLHVNGLFNDFLPVLKVPITLIYLNTDRWLKFVPGIANQKIFVRGGVDVKLFQDGLEMF